MTIELVTMFKCPETGKLFKTERGAKNSAKRARDDKELSVLAKGFDPFGFEAQRDYVRLNTTSPHQVMDLVTQKAEEFWGLKVTTWSVGRTSIYQGRGSSMKIAFGQCHIEVDSSESCRLAYMREQARISKDKWYRDPSIYDMLFGSMGFRGFDCPGGNPGRCKDSDHSGYPLIMSLEAQLEGFPLIHESHWKWVAHKKEYDDYEHEKSIVEGYGRCLARSSTEYEKLEELRTYHRNCGEIVKKSVSELESYYVEGLVQKWEAINPPVEKDTELWEMFGVGG
jgi:hypothetical protein